VKRKGAEKSHGVHSQDVLPAGRVRKAHSICFGKDRMKNHTWNKERDEKSENVTENSNKNT